MSQLQKHFNPQRSRQQNETKNNKQNNLSFRNIAAINNNQQQSYNQSQNINVKYSQHNQPKVDKSFRSICQDESRLSFYTSGQDLQQELNYVGSCFNHSNKLAEYLQTVSQRQYCKLCAAKLASKGFKLQQSQNSVQRDISPSINRFRSKDQSKILKNPNDIFESKIKPTSSNFLAPPVKFSTIISQKNRVDTLQNKYEESQKIIQDYMEIYSEKIQKIEELINDIRIKDTQYVKKLKAQNKAIFEQAQEKEQFQVERSNYDVFGKSIFKESSSSQGIKFKLPTQERIEKLSKILQIIEQTTLMRDKSPSKVTNKIPLIKSINSTESNGNSNFNADNNPRQCLLKNSSSVSNLSSKSIFKKQKKINENGDRFGSEINQNKAFKNDEIQIQSSRFSSNSGIITKKNNHSSKHNNKAQSTEFIRRKNTQNSSQGSNSCQDTPESIKSKISANSFVLPKNAAVTMFQKINVCESINVMPQDSLKEARVSQLENQQETQSREENTWVQKENIWLQRKQSSYNDSDGLKQSSYVNKSGKKSVQIRGRKSFNRYQNFNNQQ